MKFTVDEAINYAKEGHMAEWIHTFLITEGKNSHLSDIMKIEGQFYGPVEIPFSNMKRCCGPETGMKFHEAPGKWKAITDVMASEIKKGWKVTPLILWHINNELSIADGNHRLEALKLCGYDKYWSIIWFKNPADIKKYAGP
ncbi:MAG: chromosome partitioning protein ParB [Candidatus Nanoarchaeia archaeon]|jgi:hypothetical protein